MNEFFEDYFGVSTQALFIVNYELVSHY